MGIYDDLSTLQSASNAAATSAVGIDGGEPVLASNFSGYQSSMSALSGVAADLGANNDLLTAGHQVVTTTEKNNLTGVVTGTIVYDSSLNVLQMWNGSTWTTIYPVNSSGISTGAVIASKISIPSCQVRLTSNHNAGTISWSSALWNTDNMFSLSTPNTVTINTAGVYQIDLYLNGSGSPCTQIFPVVYRNGSGIWWGNITSSGSQTFGSFNMTDSFSNGDAITVSTSLGGTSPVLTGDTNITRYQSRMTVRWVSTI